MIEYIKAQNKTNATIINNSFSMDELHRFSKADFRWASNRGKNYQTRTIKKGEIYQFEFGKNFSPEMSYEHRGLIIGVKKKLLYVLPIFSYDSQKYPDVYHPVDFPNSKSDVYLLKSTEFLVLQKYFAEFYYEFENDKKAINSLKEDNTKLKEEKKSLKRRLQD